MTERNIDCWVVNMMLYSHLVYYNGHSNESGENYIQKWFIPKSDAVHWHSSSVWAQPHSTHLFQCFTKAYIPQKKSFGCRSNQSCTACYTTSSDLKLCPSTASLKDWERWKLLGVKCGEHGGQDNTSNFKSRICFKVLQAACGQALSYCRYIPEEDKPRSFLQIANFS